MKRWPRWRAIEVDIAGICFIVIFCVHAFATRNWLAVAGFAVSLFLDVAWLIHDSSVTTFPCPRGKHGR